MSFGLTDSGPHELEAIQQCLRRARASCDQLAQATGMRVGKLLEISDVTVDPSMGEPIAKDFIHIRRSFPTRFLSPTPDKVALFATLKARYELLE